MDRLTLETTLNRHNGNITATAKDLGVHRTTIYSWKHQFGILRKPRLNHDYFESIDTEGKAYFLGYLMADGCIVSKLNRLDFAIHTKDKQILDIFKYELSSSNTIRSYSKTNVSVINHTSKKLVSDLAKHGCVENKTLTLTFPSHLSEPYMWHFIRGYFDGDGCATNHMATLTNPRIRLSFIGTFSFLSSLQTIFNTSYKLALIGNNKLNSCLAITSNKNLDFIISNMYKNATIYLERKKKICSPHIKESI
jgi:hypothetical protein